MDGRLSPGHQAGARVLSGGSHAAREGCSSMVPDRPEAEPVVATADPVIAREVLRLIRERLVREEVRDESVTTVSARSRTDD
jgi:hypothetical protein